MDATQRMYLLKSAMTGHEIPSRVMQYYNIENDYDRFILARVDKIKRDRAILYDKDINNVVDSMEKSIVKRLANDTNKMIDEVNKLLK